MNNFSGMLIFIFLVAFMWTLSDTGFTFVVNKDGTETSTYLIKIQ